MFRLKTLFVAGYILALSAPAFAIDKVASAVGAASAVRALRPPLSQAQNFSLIVVYVLAIAALPISATLYDIYKSYEERKRVLACLPDKATPAEVEQILTVMDAAGPSGLTGLTRGILAVTLLVILAIPVFHFGVTGIDMPQSVSELVMLLAGSLTSVTGFYFGSKAVRDAAAKPDTRSTATPAAPRITNITPKTESAGKTITVEGEQFGADPGKVVFGTLEGAVQANGWSNTKLTVMIPATLVTGTVQVVVKRNDGAASAPYEFKVT